MWLLVDKQFFVRCLASHPANLHKDKLASMDIYEVDALDGIVGDEYNPTTGKWTAHPENYPQPSAGELEEAAVTAEVDRWNREKARERLGLSAEGG